MLLSEGFFGIFFGGALLVVVELGTDLEVDTGGDEEDDCTEGCDLDEGGAYEEV